MSERAIGGQPRRHSRLSHHHVANGLMVRDARGRALLTMGTHTASAAKSFKSAKIYSLKPAHETPVARPNSGAVRPNGSTSLLPSSPAEVRRSLNPSGDQSCPSA